MKEAVAQAMASFLAHHGKLGDTKSKTEFKN